MREVALREWAQRTLVGASPPHAGQGENEEGGKGSSGGVENGRSGEGQVSGHGGCGKVRAIFIPFRVVDFHELDYSYYCKATWPRMSGNFQS